MWLTFYCSIKWSFPPKLTKTKTKFEISLNKKSFITLQSTRRNVKQEKRGVVLVSALSSSSITPSGRGGGAREGFQDFMGLQANWLGRYLYTQVRTGARFNDRRSNFKLPLYGVLVQDTGYTQIPGGDGRGVQKKKFIRRI